MFFPSIVWKIVNFFFTSRLCAWEDGGGGGSRGSRGGSDGGSGGVLFLFSFLKKLNLNLNQRKKEIFILFFSCLYSTSINKFTTAVWV